MRACFLFPMSELNATKMLITDDADFLIIVQLSLTHFTTLFRMVKEIPYLRNHMLGMSDAVLEPPSVVFSLCKNLYQKLVFCWKVYDRCTNWKFINWYLDMTIWILVQHTVFFDRKEFELSYWWTLLRESGNNCAPEETKVWKILELSPKVSFQFLVCVEIKQEIPYF